MLNQIEFERRLKNFNPEPLIDLSQDSGPEPDIPMVTSKDGVDLAKANYLNVLNNEEIKKASEEIIRQYGVGTCGPRAFYGTTDVHLELEEKLAAFLKCEESIVYSYGFVAISSSIAAYCKKSDTVFIDEHANFPILQGLVAAKSKIVRFSHNNPNGLLDEATKLDDVEKQKKSRKFLIIEAISWKTGKICNLKAFLEIAEKFKMRIFLEESYSIGVLGKNGRGLTEHAGVDPSRVDMIFGTLEGAIGSIGGFCAGSNLIIEHQRLSGSGYIFSASLPTYLVKAVLKSLELMGDQPKKIVALAIEFHTFLKKYCNFLVESDPESPFKIFRVENNQMEKVYQYCKLNDVHLIKKIDCLMINVNCEMGEHHLQKAFTVLKNASKLA